jgi:hypothetical protein
MPAPARICIITPGHIASAPRVVKEADALAEAGYSVRVVSGRTFSPVDGMDEGILASAKWKSTRVSANDTGALLRKVLRTLSRRIAAANPCPGLKVAATAFNSETGRLGRAAAAEDADLYIGHCIPGLAAAAAAAKRRGRSYGFDAEDFHDAETQEALNDPAITHSSRALQSMLLPGVVHMTGASPLICDEYAKVYHVDPVSVLNVFPREHAPAQPVIPGPISMERPAVLYWFSQTIGPGRGLETIIEIMRRMKTPVELQLRGFTSSSYIAHLKELAARGPRPVGVRILEPGQPAEMSRLAAHADLGLSLEERVPLNHNLCLANKIFVYIMAGIPQLQSHTAAHEKLAPELGDAAILSELSDADGVARQLDAFLSDEPRMRAARKAARDLALGPFSWDSEKEKLVASVRRALGPG